MGGAYGGAFALYWPMKLMDLPQFWKKDTFSRLHSWIPEESFVFRGAEVGLGGGDSLGQSGGHSPQPPATLR